MTSTYESFNIKTIIYFLNKMLKLKFPHNLCISGVSLGMMASIWIWPGHSAFGSSIYPPQVCVLQDSEAMI